MPASAGRVRMPHNNRMTTSATLKTTDIWSKTIGHDPYANNQEPGVSAEQAAEDAQKAKKVMDMARSQNLTDGADRDDFARKMYLGLKGGKKRRADATAQVQPAHAPLPDEEDDSDEEDEFVHVVEKEEKPKKEEKTKKRDKKKKRKSKKKRRKDDCSDDDSDDDSSSSSEEEERRRKRKRKKKKHKRRYSSSSSSEQSDAEQDDKKRRKKDRKKSRRKEK